MSQQVVIERLLPIAEARAGAVGGGHRLPVRAVARGALEHPAAVPRGRAGRSGAARVVGGRARGADDGDGQCDAERQGHGGPADALHEQGAAGVDHPRDHRDRCGSAICVRAAIRDRRSALSADRRSRQRQRAKRETNVNSNGERSESREGHTGHRPGGGRRVRGRITARDLQRHPDHRHRRRRAGGHRLRGAAAPGREPRARGGDEADRRLAARHGGRSTPARRSRCRSAPRRWAGCSTSLASPSTFPIGRSTRPSTGRFTAPRRRSNSSRPN